MKNLFAFKASLFLALSACFLLLSSCGNDGVLREAFIGTFTINETCELSGDDDYEIVITASASNDDEIEIFNLYNWDEVITATVNGSKIKIPSQVADGTTFKGDGKLDGDQISFDFSVSGGLFILKSDCTAAGPRQ